jgi:drug/metabolite transporter (DMT)-like permease
MQPLNPEPALSTASANQRGIVAMLTAMTLFTASDTLVKLAASTLPPGQIMAVRGVFAIGMMVTAMSLFGQAGQIKSVFNRTVALRSAIEGAVALLFLTGIAHLPLGIINAILQATPILITLIAAVLGIERVGWRRWLAVFVGFFGVLLIVRPSPTGVDIYALLALGCAALVAIRDILTRSIRDTVSTPVVTLSAATAVTVLGFALAAVEQWQPLEPTHYLLLSGAAVVVTLGNLAVVKAFRIGEMSVVSPFRYSMVVIALSAGYLVFGEVPDLIAVAGIGLVVASGLYTLRREQIRRAEAIPAPLAPAEREAA